MKTTRLAPRVLALLVSVSLSFPPSAAVYAEPSRSTLREQQEEDPTQIARLEAALTSGSPDAFVREAASTLTRPFVAAVPSPVSPAAGLEGWGYLSDDVSRSRQSRDQVLKGEKLPQAFLNEILEPLFTKPIPEVRPELIIKGGEYRLGFLKAGEVSEDQFPILAVSKRLIESSASGQAKQALARDLVDAFSKRDKDEVLPVKLYHFGPWIRQGPKPHA